MFSKLARTIRPGILNGFSQKGRFLFKCYAVDNLLAPAGTVGSISRIRCKSTAPEPTSPPANLLKPMSFPMKLLMGPGPSNCPPRVLSASALPMLGHLHPEFTQIMDDVKDGIKYGFQTNNTWTVCVSGSGHGAMETSVCNLMEEGDKVMVCVNGLWGERFSDMASRHGAKLSQIVKPMGTVFSLEEIGKGLDENGPTIMFITHGESSGTTVQNLEGIGELCHKYNCILIVDSVAAMGGVPLFMDKWDIDVLYTGAQKVLSAPPGVSPISFSERARRKVEDRKTKVRSYYFDMKELANYWGCDNEPRRYHHTGLISSVYALREGFARLAEVGLEQSWATHAQCVQQLHTGIEDLGLELFVKEKSARLPCVTGIVVPEDVHWKDVSDYAMKNYRVEISGGLGAQAGKIWRVGLMGYNCTDSNVTLVLRALDMSYNVPGTPLTQESVFRNPVNPFSTRRMLLKSPAVPKSLEQIVPSAPQGAFFPTGYTPSSSNWSKLDDHITSTPTSGRRFLKARRTLRTSTLCFESPSNGKNADSSSVEMGTEQQVKNHIVDATGDNRRSPLKSSLCAIDSSNFNEMVPAMFVPCNQIDGSGNLPRRNAGEFEGMKDFLN